MNRVYTQTTRGQGWLRRYLGHRPRLVCVLGFTETALIPGISAAGATPHDRQTTAIADAEFLYRGPVLVPKYPLPPLINGVSPVIISRAIASTQRIPLLLFNAGLPIAPTVPHIDLRGAPAACVSTGQAMDKSTVASLFRLGMAWGHRLGSEADSNYVILGECVVGGTTTALALLTGLGFPVQGKVGSSHAVCNHEQKQAIVQQGLSRWSDRQKACPSNDLFDVVAAIGDPTQIVVAAMAITASFYGGVMLAGGTQMLAVYALARALAKQRRIPWQCDKIVVGTTRWVAEDPTCKTVELAELIDDVPLIATQLSFSESRYAPLRQYESGYVKEGVAAGACAIAANLYQHWQQPQLLGAIEALYEKILRQQMTRAVAIASEV
ncbi:TIGR00303 family protein [Oscillatoria sp. CS-180]|uniref:nicotinate mononucleotide-dependent phosphoribosyltransferase CobT n=1 Tax=Oscillatoria sp. CS-180 TaxID=3021720 RepID=UPI00232DD52D|nr:TIGR00303 family protein [Oscillatoria sp. CS-180]MDB9528118.1 TIGR00303 family protein [Oscillatoria sp. CS-180]